MTDTPEFLADRASMQYAMAHSSAELPVLQKLTRTTHLRTHLPQMLSGHTQGLLLQMISHLINPGSILEIGTFTGYSAICLAQGLQAGGKLITIEINPEMQDFAEPFFAEAGLQNAITMICGDALAVIPELDTVFDLVFIDGAKEDYTRFFEIILPKVRHGGFILADNTLWYGKVADSEANDAETLAIRQFNDYVLQCAGVEVLMLPVRDGLTLIRKAE